MRHTHLDLRRMTQRKLDALGARRQRLLKQRQTLEKALSEVERLTQPVMALLAELDAQSAPEPVAEPFVAPAARPVIGQLPMRLIPPSTGGLWK